MLLKLFIISLLLTVVSAVFLGIRILFKPGGRFPETHISRNPEMKKRGITCAQDIRLGCSLSVDPEGCSLCGKRS